MVYDFNGRFIICKVEVGQYSYCLVNLYAPNEDDPQFFTEIIEGVKLMEANFVMVGGDFNVVLDPKIDRNKEVYHNPSARQMIGHLISKEQLVDICRELNPDGKLFTWSRFDRQTRTLTWSQSDYLRMFVK